MVKVINISIIDIILRPRISRIGSLFQFASCGDSRFCRLLYDFMLFIFFKNVIEVLAG